MAKQLQMWLDVTLMINLLQYHRPNKISGQPPGDKVYFGQSQPLMQKFLSMTYANEGDWSISKKVASRCQPASACAFYMYIYIYIYVWECKCMFEAQKTKAPIFIDMMICLCIYIYIWNMHQYQLQCICPHLVRSVWDFVRHFKKWVELEHCLTSNPCCFIHGTILQDQREATESGLVASWAWK